MNVRIILALARLTVRETARRRILWVLLALSVGSVALVGWGVGSLVGALREESVGELEIRIAVSQVLILIAFMFSFVLAMSAAFLAAPAIASDVETGTVLAMLARPVRRAELILGRWLGLGIVVAGYAALSGMLAIAIVRLVSGHAPPEPLVAVGFLAFQSLTVLTLALALGTRLPGIAAGAISVVLFGLGWFAGVLGGFGEMTDRNPLLVATDVVRFLIPTDGLWRGVIYGLEPPLVVFIGAGIDESAMAANPFFASTPPPLAFVLWAVAWIAIVLSAGIALFRRREL